MFKPELLSPAGTLRNMRYAYAYGADAVYAGQPRYSLRVRNNDFGLENIGKGIEFAHARGKKFYIASNIAPHNSKLKTYLKDIGEVIALKPDALIMSDPGLIMKVRETWPDMEIHLSVQANVVNWWSVKFWYSVGVRRVIVSRELSIEEIAEIREHCPEMELEVFVHGALCIAYSGRCLLSGYINKRDPNQGSCTNSCRWNYKSHEAKETDTGDVVRLQEPQIVVPEPQIIAPPPTLGEGSTTDKMFLLEEENRPGEYMAAFEDEHGTYIMNSKDLRAIQHVEKLTELGVHSMKIEGRTKSHYYVARTAQLYREAIDRAASGQAFDMSLMDGLEKLASRGYTEGFLRRHVHDEYQNYEQGNSTSSKQQFVGEITDVHPTNGRIHIEVKNRFACGDHLELMTPQGNMNFKLENMWDIKGNDKPVAPGSGHEVVIEIDPAFLQGKELEYGLLMRELG